jgi:Toxin SymE, type I toxin-antitoxin system
MNRWAGARARRAFHVTAMRRPGRGNGRDAEVVPSLRLSERWLEEYGFGIGVRVTVEAEGGRLVSCRA